jgi:uncharacterized membrane protein
MNFHPIRTAASIIVVHIISGVTALTVGPIPLNGKGWGALHGRKAIFGSFPCSS